MRLGWPDSGTIVMYRKARNTASALKIPFKTTAVKVCCRRNIACVREMMKTSGWLRTVTGFAIEINTKRNIRFES
jgi:hypothetical protein